VFNKKNIKEDYLIMKISTILTYTSLLDQYRSWEAETYWRVEGAERVKNLHNHAWFFNKEKIEAYIDYLKKTGKSSSTIISSIAAIRWEMKNLGLPPVEVELPPKIQKIPQWLEPFEVEKLLANIPLLRDLALIILLLDTGVRVSEALNIHLEDIDFEERIVFINKRKGSYIPVAIPFTERTKNILLNYITTAKITSGKIFTMHIATAERIIKRWGQIILNKNITPHVLRHTKAVALRKAGVSLEDIADFLGHKSIETTRRYARITATHLKELPETI